MRDIQAGPSTSARGVEDVGGQRTEAQLGAHQCRNVSRDTKWSVVEKTNVNSNKCVQNFYVPNVGGRMKAPIDDIYKKLPEATIVLSTLVRS